MASLTQASTTARRVIRYTVYTLVFIIVARATILMGIKAYRFFFPEPAAEPEVCFGKLPNLPFPEKDIPENLTYTLETPEGELPEFPDQLDAYFMPQEAPSIGALEEAQQKASSLGFDPSGTELVETVYVFPNKRAASSLTINIVNGVFSVSYDLDSDPTVLGRIPPPPETATARARSYLTRGHLVKDDLSGPITHDFVKIEQGKFVPAISLSEADLIKVNFFRKDYEETYPSKTPDPAEANVWFMLGGATGTDKQIIAAEYHYFPVDEDESCTYPLKTAQETWDELQSGAGYLASPGENQSGNITVRRVYLGYYDAGQYTEFLQPIVVFEGDNDFVGYVPAVASEYYGE